MIRLEQPVTGSSGEGPDVLAGGKKGEESAA
jgi:hypothetical protein